jgi:hypothetical protein
VACVHAVNYRGCLSIIVHVCGWCYHWFHCIIAPSVWVWSSMFLTIGCKSGVTFVSHVVSGSGLVTRPFVIFSVFVLTAFHSSSRRYLYPLLSSSDCLRVRLFRNNGVSSVSLPYFFSHTYVTVIPIRRRITVRIVGQLSIYLTLLVVFLEYVIHVWLHLLVSGAFFCNSSTPWLGKQCVPMCAQY